MIFLKKKKKNGKLDMISLIGVPSNFYQGPGSASDKDGKSTRTAVGPASGLAGITVDKSVEFVGVSVLQTHLSFSFFLIGSFFYIIHK